MTGKAAPGKPRPATRRGNEGGRLPWRRIVVGVCGAALVLAGVLYVNHPEPVEDLDAQLLHQGFTPNPGFAFSFRPGDVLQIAETDGKGGGRPLPRPVLFLRKEDCFPTLSPTEVAFAVASRSGQRSGSLKIDAAKATRLLARMRLGGQEVRSYSLSIDRPRIATFARADLSGRFARTCVERFGEALDGGDQPAWFATVIETVVADALTLTVEWSAKASGEARAQLAANVRRELPGASGPVTTTLDSSEKTVLRATGPVLLGYRYRPMEPVK